MQDDKQGKFVLLVGPDNKVKQQPIEVGRQIAQDYIVTKGLSGGERVIVEGVQKVQSGETVNPSRPPYAASSGHRGGRGRTRRGRRSRRCCRLSSSRRPKFAIVISIVITLAGLLALSAIPISQYPNITPPPGHGFRAPIRAQTPKRWFQHRRRADRGAGQRRAPDMLYMQSTSSSSGTYSLTVTFAIGTDPNIDQVNVQNRLQLAEALLPTVVQQEGLTVRPAYQQLRPGRQSVFARIDKYDQVTISNYAYLHLCSPSRA